jgi:hypothetical protein
MKVKFFYHIAVVSLLLLATSCSNADLLTIESNADLSTIESNAEPTSRVEYLTVTYEGKTYKSIPTTYDVRGNFVFQDEVFSSRYRNEIDLLPELSIFMVRENEIELYKNLNELLEKKGLTLLEGVQIEETQLRSSTLPGYDHLAALKLHDDKNFKDRFVQDSLNYSRIIASNANLGNSPHNFNDKCSSLIITNNIKNSTTETIQLGGQTFICANVSAVFIGYDDKNYSDRTIVCIANAGTVTMEASLPGFNDKLSSYKFLFAQKGQYISKW